MTTETQRPSIDEAKQLIKEKETERLQECGQQIEAILQKYECQLVAVPQIYRGSIVAEVTLAPKQE